MKIFITGGNGFIGKYLSQYLQTKNHLIVRPTSSECDLLEAKSLSTYTKEKYDLIFHLATYVQAGDFPQKYPADIWIKNQKIHTNVLDFWYQYQPQAKLIFPGTSCAYPPGGNLKEKDYMWNKPHDSLISYAMTKRMLYQGALSFREQYGLSYLCVVPSTLYGGEYHTDGRQMHFIFDLIRKIIRGKEYGVPVTLWGNGYQKREIVFIKDFVRILYDLTQKESNDIFNIGAGKQFSIRAFAKCISKIIGYNPKNIQYDPSRYVGATSKCLNIEKTKSVTDYTLTPVEQGLKETIEWFYTHKAY